MHKEFLMGNEAIALGAMAAGVNVVSGYPGTPSLPIPNENELKIHRGVRSDCQTE